MDESQTTEAATVKSPVEVKMLYSKRGYLFTKYETGMRNSQASSSIVSTPSIEQISADECFLLKPPEFHSSGCWSACKSSGL